MASITDALDFSALGADLTEEQAREIYPLGQEATILALMALASKTAASSGTNASASTPSGQQPVYTKPTTARRKKKPGRKAGHVGSQRGVPERIDQRLMALLEIDWQHPDAVRLSKRMRKYQDHLFAFLDTSDVPPDNNGAERMIRPAVIIRKNSYTNRSDRGAITQAVLMSIYRTLKQRGDNPLDTITEALRDYLKTGQIRPLPGIITADG